MSPIHINTPRAGALRLDVVLQAQPSIPNHTETKEHEACEHPNHVPVIFADLLGFKSVVNTPGSGAAIEALSDLNVTCGDESELDEHLGRENRRLRLAMSDSIMLLGSVELEIVAPPGMDAIETRVRLDAAVAEIERRKKQQMREDGRKFLGEARVSPRPLRQPDVVGKAAWPKSDICKPRQVGADRSEPTQPQ